MKLSREQRASLFAGELPRIAHPGSRPCPVEIGERYALGPRFWIEVTEIRTAKDGSHVLRYNVFDQRAKGRFLRRTPGISKSDFNKIRRSFDAWGYPEEATPDVVKKAAEESAYTSSPVGTVGTADEAIPREDQDEISKRAREKWLNYKQVERAEEQARQDAKRFAAQVRDILITNARAGVDSTSFLIQLQRAAEGQEQKAA